MTEPSGRQQPADRPGASWEQRAAGLASEIQRWLIRTSARNMRDELGGQVKKAFRGSGEGSADPWATATTEPPHAADEPPECAWCPFCRAARLIARTRAGADSHGGPKLSDAADTMANTMRDAFAGLDSILSYRPGEPAPSRPAEEAPQSAQEMPSRPAQETPSQPGAAGPAPDAPVGESATQPPVKSADDPNESTRG